MTLTAPRIVSDPSPPVPLPPGMALPGFIRRTRQFLPPALYRECPVHLPCSYEFRKRWAMNKRAFLERGFTCRNFADKWFLQQWLELDGSLTAITLEKLAALDGEKQAEKYPVLPPYSLPDLAPEIAAKLFDYQVNPARQLLRALRCGRDEWGTCAAMDWSELGTGKTYTSLAAALSFGNNRIGVLCPKVGASGWNAAAEHFGHSLEFVTTYEALRGGYRPQWATVDEQGVQWRDPAQRLIIFDEAHLMRHHTTLNHKLGDAALRQGIPLIALSATIATSPLEMEFAGRAIGLHKGGRDFERFMIQHGCRKIGSTWKFQADEQGRKRLAAIHATVFPRRGARVCIDELGERFPETTIELVAIRTAESQRVEELFRDAERQIDAMRRTTPAHRLEMWRQKIYMHAWHESERHLLPGVVALAKEELAEDRSVALFCSFDDTRRSLMDAFRTSCTIYGGQSQKQRAYWVQEFQADRQRVIVCNIGAGGVSVSLQDRHGWHPRTAIILPTNKVVDMKQATGRVHRAGGKTPSRQYIPYAPGGLMERMVRSLRSKMKNISAINDGDADAEADI